jgi:hypothetical protein
MEADTAGDGLVSAYLANSVRMSADPGLKLLPPDEAGRLVRARHAVYGEAPPRGYDDGGVDGQGLSLMVPQGG